METIKELKRLLNLNASQFADLFGISYEYLSDILEGKEEPSSKLLAGCKIAKQIFLRKSDT